MTLIPVTPIGKRMCVGFQCPGGLTSWEEDEYPKWAERRGKELRDARVAASKGLLDAMRLLGLSAKDVSHLERGRAVLSDDEHARAIALLAT